MSSKRPGLGATNATTVPSRKPPLTFARSQESLKNWHPSAPRYRGAGLDRRGCCAAPPPASSRVHPRSQSHRRCLQSEVGTTGTADDWDLFNMSLSIDPIWKVDPERKTRRNLWFGGSEQPCLPQPGTVCFASDRHDF